MEYSRNFGQSDRSTPSAETLAAGLTGKFHQSCDRLPKIAETL
ncbi:hypothetical protein ACQ4M3_19445 [Leptolyngbya sp. AN03gr2]